jgi:hypothetical protein
LERGFRDLERLLRDFARPGDFACDFDLSFIVLARDLERLLGDLAISISISLGLI